MTLNDVLLYLNTVSGELQIILNAASCAVIATMLGTFQRHGAKYRFLPALFTFIVIVASGSIVILIVTGHYNVADKPETVINIAFCIAIVMARGNIMKIIRRPDRNKSKKTQ